MPTLASTSCVIIQHAPVSMPRAIFSMCAHDGCTTCKKITQISIHQVCLYNMQRPHALGTHNENIVLYVCYGERGPFVSMVLCPLEPVHYAHLNMLIVSHGQGYTFLFRFRMRRLRALGGQLGHWPNEFSTVYLDSNGCAQIRMQISPRPAHGDPFNRTCDGLNPELFT